MAGSLVVWITLALFIFWGVGLYNRLMRMRARGLGALGSVQKHMHHFSALVQEVSHGVENPPGQTAGHWSGLLEHVQALEESLKDATATPWAPQVLARLGADYGALQESWRLWVGMPADLAGPAVPLTLQTQWAAISQRVDSARNGFNQIVTKYNEALDQIPARWVAAAMGFKPGGLL